MSPRPAIDHIRRPQILRAAAEVITERGFAATRVADVAARAGTSAPAVLYWFESREQLLSEALTADEVEFDTLLDSRLEGLRSSKAKLAAILRVTAEQIDMSLWIELWARSLHDAASAAERLRLDKAWRNRIATVVEEGQVAGELDEQLDGNDFAFRLAALMDGLSVQVTLADPSASASRMLEACVEFTEQALGLELDQDLQDTRGREPLAEGGRG